MLVVLFGGVGYYLWDYNTSPTGGKARACGIQYHRRTSGYTLCLTKVRPWAALRRRT